MGVEAVAPYERLLVADLPCKKAECDKASPRGGQCEDSGIEYTPPLVPKAREPLQHVSDAFMTCRDWKGECEEAKPKCSQCNHSDREIRTVAPLSEITRVPRQ